MQELPVENVQNMESLPRSIVECWNKARGKGSHPRSEDPRWPKLWKIGWFVYRLMLPQGEEQGIHDALVMVIEQGLFQAVF